MDSNHLKVFQVQNAKIISWVSNLVVPAVLYNNTEYYLKKMSKPKKYDRFSKDIQYKKNRK